MNPLAPAPDVDPVHFLKIAGQGAALQTHADLWRWLQGDVQRWLAHDVMLIGWGDFRSGELHYDIVSSLPGMRSHHYSAAAIAPLLSYFRDCWVAAQHSPCQLHLKGIELLGNAGRDCAASSTMARMRTALVHGIGDGRHTVERIFAALSGEPCPPSGGGGALRLLLPFIDTALRQIPALPARQGGSGRKPVDAHAGRLHALSDRERQIMVWVAMGKTNPEIGCILRISEFTVKNHLKSIFGKLHVSNRAQAVAQLNRSWTHA